MNTLKKYKYDIFIFLFIAALIVLFVAIRDKFGFLSDRESFELYIEGFGVWAPLMIVLVIILEVVIAPLPGFVPAISAGFIFGPVEGAFYTYIGNVIGSLLVFLLARRFGRLLVEKIFEAEKIEKYERLIGKRENILLILYFIPLLPVDILSGAFGLSGISFKKFAIAISIGFVFYVAIFNLFGDYLARLYFVG